MSVRVLKSLLAILAFCTAVAVLVAAGLPDRARATAIGYLPNGLPIAPEVGAVAPSFSILGLDQRPFLHRPEVPTVINFWATWCGPCIFELPMLGELQRKYPEVQFIAVNMGENIETVRAWLVDNPISLSIALDPDQTTVRRYRVRGAPSTFFVDREGIIHQIVYGALPPDGLESRLKIILDRKG